MAAGVIIARSLGPEGKGVYSVAILLATLAVTFGQLGLSQSLIYHIGRKHLSPERAMGTILTVDFAFSVGLMALTLLLATRLSATLLRGVAPELIILAVLLIPVKLLSGHLRSMMRAMGRIRAFSIFSLSESVSQLGAVAILIAFSALTISRVIVIELALGIILLFACLAVSARELRGWPRLGLKGSRSLLSFGFKGHTGVVFADMERRFDVLLLNAYLLPAQVGLYAVGVGAAQLVLFLTNAMSTVLFPLVSRSSPDQVRQFLPRISRLSILFSALFGIGLVLIGKPLISLLYGSDFGASYGPMVILLPGIVMLTIARICEVYLQGTGRPGKVSAVAGITFVVNLGANLILIPDLGINGAAYASTISYSLGACILLAFFLRDSRLGVREVVVPSRSDIVKMVDAVAELARSKAPSWIDLKSDRTASP